MLLLRQERLVVEVICYFKLFKSKYRAKSLPKTSGVSNF